MTALHTYFYNVVDTQRDVTP